MRRDTHWCLKSTKHSRNGLCSFVQQKISNIAKRAQVNEKEKCYCHRELMTTKKEVSAFSKKNLKQTTAE